MSPLSRFILAATLGFSVAVNATVISYPRLNAPQALYFMTNNPNQTNSVVAIPIGRDGQFRKDGMTITPTGGLGGATIDPFTGTQPAAGDALGSLGSVRVVGRNLFVVNAASNTLTMFTIDNRDPTKLTMLGTPMNTRGEFPITVGVSQRRRLACVGHNGAQSGVSCASYSTRTGLKPFDARRDFGLNNITPPFDVFNGISTVFFSEDDNILFADVKGIPRFSQLGLPITGIPELASFGFVAAFRVNHEGVAYDMVRSLPEGAGDMFGAVIIPGTKDIVLADPSYGGGVITYDENTLITTTKVRTVFPTSLFVCWVGYSEVTETAFFTDGAVNNLIELDVNSGEIVSIVNASAKGIFGQTDLDISGGFLYTLSAGFPTNRTGLTVYDISGGRGTAKVIQSFFPGPSWPYSHGVTTWG
ncbi:MAG: hypothetical protein Q9187_008741, partial [Circinaria calcarea]